MDGFDREAVQRLPLEDIIDSLLADVTAEPFLQEVDQRHRGTSYQKTLTFPQFDGAPVLRCETGMHRHAYGVILADDPGCL